jgi:hypothetical protein
MTLVTISIIIATLIFVVYNIPTLIAFNVPKSLSMTYYLWQELNSKMKFAFPLMMYLVVAFMMPAWITMSEGSTWQFLSFLAPAAILFVGTAPAFKSSSLENTVHQVSAYLAAALSVLWIVLVTPYWWVTLVWLALVALASIMTSTYKTSYLYWLELAAFGSTFTSTIAYSI